MTSLGTGDTERLRKKLLSLLDTSTINKIVDVVVEVLETESPELVYDKETLGDWAERNGYFSLDDWAKQNGYAKIDKEEVIT